MEYLPKQSKRKDLVLTLIAIISVLIVAVPLWLYLGYWSLLICLTILVNALVFISYKNDISIPVVGSFFKKEYDRVNIKLNNMKTRGSDAGYNMYTISFHFFISKIYLKILYYLLLISCDSQKSFEDIVDQNSPLGIEFDQNNGGFKSMPDKVKQAYMKEYLELHKIKQRRVSLFSFVGTGVIVIATVTVSLITTLILPAVFNSQAATYGWNQSDWSGTVTTSHASIFDSGWSSYYQKDENIRAEKVLTIDQVEQKIIHKRDLNFVGGNTSSTKIVYNSIVLEDEVEFGYFESEVIDTNNNIGFGEIDWQGDVSGVKVRSFNKIDKSDVNDWLVCDLAIDNQDISINNCVTDQDRYLQYYVEFTDPSQRLDEISVSYSYYPECQTLVSSPIDTKNETNVVRDIFWTEKIFSDTEIKFQIRTSNDAISWTDWLGPKGKGDFYLDAGGSNEINISHRDGILDRYVQYKVYLISVDGRYAPMLRDVAFITDNSAVGPIIANVDFDVISSNKVIISWQTNIPSIAMLEYGLYDGGSTAVKMEKEFDVSHQIVLDDLKPDTEYYFKIISQDSNDDFANSPEYYFKTL